MAFFAWLHHACLFPFQQVHAAVEVESSDIEPESDASVGGDASRRAGSTANALLHVEAFALVQLCSSGFITRKLALLVLREVRSLSLRLHRAEGTTRPPSTHVMDVFEAESHFVIQEHLRQVREAPAEQRFSRGAIAMGPLLEQMESTFLDGEVHKSVILSEMLADLSLQKVLDLKPAAPGDPDIWTSVLCTLVQGSLLLRCPRLVHLAWNCTIDFLVVSPVVAYEHLLLRGTSPRNKHVSRPTEEDTMFFRTLVSFGCASLTQETRVQSPGFVRSESDHESTDTENSSMSSRTITSTRQFLQFVVPLLRAVTPCIRKMVSMGLGYTKFGIYDLLSHQMAKFVMDSLDLRSESARKKQQRDCLRLEVARVHRWTAFAAVKCYVKMKDNTVRLIGRTKRDLLVILVSPMPCLLKSWRRLATT